MSIEVHGHTVRRAGPPPQEIVATITYAGGYTNVRSPETGEVIGRLVQAGSEPDRFDAWTASHPAAATPSDEKIADDVPAADAVEAILARHEQSQRRQTTIRYQDSDDYPGGSVLVMGRGPGQHMTEMTLADLEELQRQTGARIASLREVRRDGAERTPDET